MAPSLSRGVEAVKKWGVGHVKYSLLAFLFGIFFAVISVIGQTFEIPMIYFLIGFGVLYRLLNLTSLHWVYRLMVTILICLGVSVLLGEEERDTLKDAFQTQFSHWKPISMFGVYILLGVFLYSYLV